MVGKPQNRTAAMANGALQCRLHAEGATELEDESCKEAAAQEASLSKIQELTEQLVSASKAVDFASSAAVAAGTGHWPGSSSTGMDSAKEHRIQELRVALMDAMKERDELQQLLNDGGAHLQQELATARRQLVEMRQEVEACKVRLLFSG
jgi:hypothetical protein